MAAFMAVVLLYAVRSTEMAPLLMESGAVAEVTVEADADRPARIVANSCILP